jgi:hypothetical protein
MKIKNEIKKANLFSILKQFICIVILLNGSSAFSQSMPEKCELNGSLFYTDCIKYLGDCENNKANGWGDLYFKNNNIFTGLFVDNILRDFHMDVFFTDKNYYAMGPNKGARFHGPCVLIFKDRVSFVNYDNGQNVGNSDYFHIPEPKFEYNGIFCDEYGIRAKDGILIPETNLILYLSSREYNSRGDWKYWISIVDLSLNKITRTFGSYVNPIRTCSNEKPKKPLFSGFSADNQFAFFDIRGNIKEVPKFLKCNLSTGISEIKNELPLEITNRGKFIEKLNSLTYKDLGTLKGHETLDKFQILKDSTLVKIFNSKIYLKSVSDYNNYLASKLELGLGSSIVLYSKDFKILKSLELPNMNIFDFAIDENSNRIALSYQGKDSTFLAYYDLVSFKLITKVFSHLDGQPGAVKFSKTGSYLLYKFPFFATHIYLGTKLHFGIEGEVYDLSDDDNIIVTNSNDGFLNAYDLEKKTIIWRYPIGDQYLNSKCFNINNKMYIISGRPLAWEGTKVIKNGIKINSFAMPKPLFSLTEFVRKQYEITSASNAPKIENTNKPAPKADSKVSSSNDDFLASYLALKFLYALFETTSHTSGNSSGTSSSKGSTPSSNSGATRKKCSACKPSDDKGWWITDYDYVKRSYLNGRYIKNIGHKPCPTCQGQGTYKKNDSSGDILTCYQCHGDRWIECDRCHGDGEEN